MHRMWYTTCQLVVGRLSLRATILLSLLLVIAIIQVLPQVDLPDTAFHEDTLPRAARCGVLAHAMAAVIPAIELRRELTASHSERTLVPAHPVNEPLSTLFSTLLC